MALISGCDKSCARRALASANNWFSASCLSSFAAWFALSHGQLLSQGSPRRAEWRIPPSCKALAVDDFSIRWLISTLRRGNAVWPRLARGRDLGEGHTKSPTVQAAGLFCAYHLLTFIPQRRIVSVSFNRQKPQLLI